MICPEKVQELCLFGMMCPREAVVEDDSECAAYIRRVLAKLEGVEPAQADPVEDAELAQEREAIREECEAPKPCPFCGGEAETGRIVSTLWIIGCNTPMCYGNINHLTMYFTEKEDAIKAWNRRNG